MPYLSILFGALLIGVGVYGYVGAEESARSITALIPAFAGGLLVLAGAIALVERFLKHAMHFAAMVGLLGFLMSGGRLGIVLSKGKDIMERSSLSMLVMAGLCLVFVGLCVNSFIQVRRRRRAAQG